MKKKAARQAASVYPRQFNQGASQPQFDITTADFWTLYFEPQILPTLKPATRKLYSCLAMKHLLPHFGNLKLCEIQRIQVQQFIGVKRCDGCAAETLGHLRNLLSKIFSTTMDWGWLHENTARGAKLPPTERKCLARVLSAEEINKLLSALSEPSRTVAALGVATGLRIGKSSVYSCPMSTWLRPGSLCGVRSIEATSALRRPEGVSGKCPWRDSLSR